MVSFHIPNMDFYLQIWSYSEILRGRYSAYEFRGRGIKPTQKRTNYRTLFPAGTITLVILYTGKRMPLCPRWEHLIDWA
jgi:hypothetical protein